MISQYPTELKPPKQPLSNVDIRTSLDVSMGKWSFGWYEVRTGGKGTARRTKLSKHVNNGADAARLCGRCFVPRGGGTLLTR